MAALNRPTLPVHRTFGGKRSVTLLLFVAIALLVAIAVFQVNQFSRATSTSYEINALTSQRAQRQAENHALEADVARLSSLARVDIEARTRLHMEPAQQKLYIAVNQAVPDRRSLPTRFLPPERAPAIHPDAPLWKQLLRIVPFF